MSADLPLVHELSAVYARMSGLLLSEESVGTALCHITSLAQETLPGVLGAGVTLIDERGRRTTAAASTSLTELADSLQYELDEGPCLAAWAQRRVFRVDDLPGDGRWPRWAEAASALGMRASLSVPLVARDTALGAIKVYSDRPFAFADPDGRSERLLTGFAAQAAILVANVQSLESARRLSESLQEALRTRDTIATAKGILMARDGTDEETAFATLAGVSMRENRTLRDVAADLVAATARRRR